MDKQTNKKKQSIQNPWTYHGNCGDGVYSSVHRNIGDTFPAGRAGGCRNRPDLFDPFKAEERMSGASDTHMWIGNSV